ncbi:MAG: ABC transporter substrate-binding protein [Qipengyuania vulgaris]
MVSLNPCTDAILAEVTAPGQLLAISHYSKDPSSSSMEPEDAARFAATGGTVEEVLALDPDVVVASSFLAPATRAALEELGVEVVTFGGTATVEDSLAQVRELAALVGNEAAGERLVTDIASALEEVSPDRPALEAALWQPGGIVPGEASLVSDLLRRTGFAGYGAARGMAQADYLSLEQVVTDPPEVLLIAGSERGQAHPALDNLAGMRRESFDTRLIYCGGPTIIRAAERLAEIRTTMLPREDGDIRSLAKRRIAGDSRLRGGSER